MLKQKIDTAALFAQKKTEVHSGNEEKTGSIVYYHPAAFYRTWCKTDID